MEKTRVELEVEDRQEPMSFEVESTSATDLLAAIRGHSALGDEMLLFERDKDSTAGVEIEGKRALMVVAHRCRQVLLTIRYEHRTEQHKFAPSATVFRVLQWAVKAFKLDDTARAKANLMLPGADQPLPKDTVIGRYVSSRECSLTVDLTLRDFTNG